MSYLRQLAISSAMVLAIAVPAGSTFAKPVNKNHVFNATVQSVSGTTISATQGGVTYSIDASSSRINRRYGAKADISEILNGDIINVWGKVDGTNITARKIRDLSIQKANAIFEGSISSIDATNKTFVLHTNKRGDQTIQVTDSTKITYRGKTAKTFDDLHVGDQVLAKGVWNRTHTLVYKTNLVRIQRFAQ